MKRQLKWIVPVLIFLLLAGIAVAVVGQALVPKAGAWALMQDFYALPENSLDVLFLGASHTYYAYNPTQMWRDMGFTGYVLAQPSQPLWITYYYLLEALQTQSPKAVVLDTFFACYTDDSVLPTYTRMSIDCMKLSTRKLGAALSSGNDDSLLSYVFPFFRYLDRLGELTRQDFTPDLSTHFDPTWRGYYVTRQVYEGEIYENPVSTESTPLTPKNRAYLNKIISLCEKEGIELVLVCTPYMYRYRAGVEFRQWSSVPEQVYNTLAELAQEHKHVTFLSCDTLMQGADLSWPEDLMDEGHLNFFGATKLSAYLGQWLQQTYSLPDRRQSEGFEQWHAYAKLLTDSANS